MMRSVRRPSPSMAVAITALVVALGGTSYAAVALPRNSVGAAQLRSKSVGNAELKANSVTSAKVRNGTLRAQDFRAGTLLQGAKGDKGDTGAKGDTGTTGAQGPAGTAAAFARVAADGTLLPVTNAAFGAQNKAIEATNITNPAAGVYCFAGLSFTPHAAMVSADNAGAAAATQNNFTVSVAIERGAGLGGCPADTQARVVTTTWTDAVAPANANHGFNIWFEA